MVPGPPLRPPTSFLLRIRDDPHYEDIQDNLDELKRIYAPTFDDSDDDDDDDDEGESNHQLLLQDTHERDYTQAWLRRLIDSQCLWMMEDADEGHDLSFIDDILDDAATLSERLTELAAGGGNHNRGRVGGSLAPADETLERSFTFPFDFERLGKKRKSISSSPAATSTTNAGQGQPRVSVTLIDEPLPPSGNDDTGANEADSAAEAVGVQTWAAAIVLADLIVRTPGEMHKRLGGGGKGINVAELGAGTGLVGIVCAQLLAAQQQQQARVNEEVSHRVVLTDYHSLVLANLRRNVAANPVASTSMAAIQMSVESLDWSHYYREQPTPSSAATPSSSAASGQQYDLLLAADVVYSPLHAQWLYSTMSSLLTQRSSARAHVINAKREQGRFGEWGLVKLTDDAFGPVWDGVGEEDEGEGQWKLVVLKRTEMAKRKGLGRGDESGHVWWTLGWKRVGKSTGEGRGGGTGEAA